MKFSRNQLLLVGACSLTAVMVMMAIAGAVRAYSPVPYWDMWDGYLRFFLAVGDGNMAAWWAQQNEHRILLSHLLFWADLQWFGGAGAFLIVCNYLLLGAVALLFWRMLRARLLAPPRSVAQAILGLFLTAWLFSWMQQENLTWAFQSQFILAQLLPLCAFYALYLTLGAAGMRHFALACLCGLAAVGSMANGILALPMMLGYAVLTRQGWRRCLILAVLAVLALGAYFHGYHGAADRPSFVRMLLSSPWPMLEYVLRYLGSPFYFLAAEGDTGKSLALFAGAVAILGAAWQALLWIRQRGDALALTLLLFIAYIGATALGTASGRLYLGADQAFASRYTTPALMLWAALLLLYAPGLLRAARTPKRQLAWALPFVLLALPMLGLQAQALKARTDQVFDKKMAGLALELGIADQPEVLHVYPQATTVLPVAERAQVRHLSIFGLAPWRGRRDELGQVITPSTPSASLPACQGSLDAVTPVDGDVKFLRVVGWLLNPAGQQVPAVLRFIDAQGRVAGVAFSGKERPDVAAAVGENARMAGFAGYVLASYAGTGLTIQGAAEAGTCALAAPIPTSLVRLTTTTPKPAGTLGVAALLPGNQWLGDDYDHTKIAGIQVYGSFIQADSDTGAISLRVKRGDRLYYRSGPTAGRQLLEVPSSDLAPVRLPARETWALLEFSGAALPEGEFTVTFRDAGDGWGEWSAIALALPAPPALSQPAAPDRFGALSGAAPAVAAANCEGVLDSVNGMPPGAALTARGSLVIQGWMTLLPPPRRAANHIHVVLTDATGKRLYAPAHVLSRPDVAAHFQQPGLSETGYSLNADLGALQGAYTLGLAVEQDGRTTMCEQYHLPISIGATEP